MLTRIRRRLAQDSGFTLSELMVVVLLTGIVVAIVLTTMSTFLRVTNATQSKSFALQGARTAIEKVAKQVRAANPIDPLAVGVPISTYDTQLSFSVYCSTPGTGTCGSDSLRRVSYKLQSNALTETIGTVTRTIAGPEGPAAVPVALRRGAVVNTASQPLFRYYDRNGVAFSTVPGVGPPSTTFRDCVRSVEIHVVVIAEHRKADKTIDLSTRVDLRNFNEVPGC